MHEREEWLNSADQQFGNTNRMTEAMSSSHAESVLACTPCTMSCILTTRSPATNSKLADAQKSSLIHRYRDQTAFVLQCVRLNIAIMTARIAFTKLLRHMSSYCVCNH